jgi:tetratricopeptide (TPR) repeat protein
MHYALAKQWEQAYRYALQAIAVRNRFDMSLTIPDFSRHHEIEALLRGGDERQARAEIQRLGEHVGASQRFRVPYLRSLALLAAWEGNSEQAITYLLKAARLAVDLGLPGEQWQIQTALGMVYETAGEQVNADTSFAEAARIIQRLAQGIGDETLRTSFLAGSQIQPVLQQAQNGACLIPKDHSGRKEH